MSKAYTVQPGDTYADISRKQYGDESYARNIAEANPGAPAQPQVGSVIVTPDIPELELDDQRKGTLRSDADKDLVTLTINGKVFRFWSNVNITQHLDAVSTVNFNSPFEPDQEIFREAFRPYSYQEVRIDVGGQLLFTGTLVNPVPTLGPRERSVSARCYSKPGVLSDCTPPASAYPLQWDAATLRTIAADVCRPFGVSVVFPEGSGLVFERISLDPGSKVMPDLARFASQRNLVIRSNERGQLVFLRPKETGEPVARFREGLGPLQSVTPSIGSQQFYSHITGVAPSIVGLEGPQATVVNPRLKGVLRPYVYPASDTEEGGLQEAVRSKIGRMYAESASYEVELDTWRDVDGNIWQPGDFVTLTAPGCMVYSEYTFQIRTVYLKATPNEQSATLNLIIPGTLSGKVPETLPWDDSQL